MLKKLQNLLFEDEEGVEEDIDEEEEVVVRPAKRKQTADEVAEQPARKQESVSMQRIDVTQEFPAAKDDARKAAANESVFRKPTPVQHANPRPIASETVQQAEKPRTSLGLTVDDLSESKQAKPAAKPAPAPKKKTVSSNVYEFKPVISPMFGVDEKDLDALQTSAKSAKLKMDDNTTVSKIISPIYGMNKEAEPTSIQTSVEKSNAMENMTYNKEARRAEENIPDFSLDDILSGHDEEFTRKAAASGSLLDDVQDIDETVVIDSKGLAGLKNHKGE